MTRKYILISVAVIATIILIAVLETLYAEPGLSLAVGLFVGLIIGPALIVSSFVISTGRVTMKLASKKVSTQEKNGILKRTLIVILLGCAGVAVFLLLNAIGTELIEL